MDACNFNCRQGRACSCQIADKEYAESRAQWVDDLICDALDAAYKALPWIGVACAVAAGVCWAIAFQVAKT